MTFNRSPTRLCGVGKTGVDMPGFATFDGDVQACFGANPMATFSGKAEAGKLGATGNSVADIDVVLDSAAGLVVNKARLVVPNRICGRRRG